MVMTAAHGAVPGKASPKSLLAELVTTSESDHAHFLSTLHALEKQRGQLNMDQQLNLLYWEALEAQNQSHYSQSLRLLKQVVEQSTDSSLTTRAKILMIKLFLVKQNYVKAFTLANALIAHLDKIANPNLREMVLYQANQILVWQKQYDQALKLARQMKAHAKSGKDLCRADFAVTNTLLQRGSLLSSSSPQFKQTVEQCMSAGMMSTADTLRLNWMGLILEEGHTKQALAFLHRVTPDIIKDGYHANTTGLYVDRALAYLAAGNDKLARKWAQVTLSDIGENNYNWKVQTAHKVLYQVEEHEGRYAAALDSYKKYVAQKRKATDEAKAQALAYQVVQQEVQSKRLKLAELTKQNRILQLRQSLDSKSAEANRLYIALLLLVLASIAFWAWRIKHSQIRFRRMARHDDLTGIFNRQYFFDQAGHTLQRLQNSGSEACLMILDMDHFKRINDAYGHVAGDIVLKHVVQTCRRELRDSDVFGRLGGEEFGILMPGCSIPQGLEIGERVRRALAQSPVRIRDSETVTVTSSIGLACSRFQGHALKPLLIAADEALYSAKHAGRNQIMVNRGKPRLAPA